jgi:Lar family restriction alleviation protein
MDELKPCPFCRDTASLKARKLSAIREVKGACVTCYNCGADGPWANTVAEATADWNRRAAPDALVEALKKAMPAMFAARNRLALIDNEDDAKYWIVPLEEAWEAARILVRPNARPLDALRPVERGEEGAVTPRD